MLHMTFLMFCFGWMTAGAFWQMALLKIDESVSKLYNEVVSFICSARLELRGASMVEMFRILSILDILCHRS